VIGNGAAVAKDLASPQRQGPGYGATSFPTSVDAPEYLPRGLLRMAADGPAPVVDIRALAARPLASGPAARWAAPEAGGGVRVELANSADRRIGLARFYVPSGRVTCDGVEVAAAAVTPARLVGFAPPPGARSCEARIGSTGAERVGGAIGLAAVLALVLYALWAFAPRARFKPAAARSAAG
jgi:hypothetical protein